ncbi:MAG: DNA helicase RecQ [Saprospiraceae bacterium]|nr:DNA helicase RecQ [Saprospiraceae bacterium]
MNLETAHLALKKFFGYDSFRPLQKDIIQQIYDGRDTLVLMPTGCGKSICFQIPAVTLDGVAIVISPLIALMKDQVEGLSANGVPAAFINSSINYDQQRRVEDALMQGHIKLLYVSPEKAVSQGFQPLLKSLKISLFAIDEAHCISSWGHDFRPEYTQLKFLKNQFPNIPLVALTATADKLTRKDIVSQLGMRDPSIFISSFDRPNISLKVSGGQRRFEQIVEFLKQHPGNSGIIYCLGRNSCQILAEKLNAKGFKADYYHAELSNQQRNKVQDDFINDRTPIICATIAFGMGIDKSNVRFVIHYNLPRNLEGYYQEIGRAGRDGLPSEALLFFSYGDVISYRDMFMQSEGSLEQKELKIKKLERMYEFAEAPVCRRRTVLAYFDEAYERDCGNCDICLNPPRRFDGTVAAQKALSAIVRSQERVGMNMLVDVLRGSARREIMEMGLNQIKTYGAGREYTFDDWIFLLSQMLHLGLLEIAYDAHNVLRVTEAGKKVLFEGKTVQLALPQPKEKAKKAAEKQLPEFKPKSKTEQLQDELLNLLIALRRLVAQQKGTPPHQVFSDVTLRQMAEKRPLTDAEMLDVSGVGERKLQLYGDAFMAEIRRFVLEKLEEGQRIIGSSPFQTYSLYKQGRSPQEIADMRGQSLVSIMNHLATMYEKGEMFEINEWISPEALDIITGSLSLFPEPLQLKEIHEHFNGRYSYDEIRWAVAHQQRMQFQESRKTRLD